MYYLVLLLFLFGYIKKLRYRNISNIIMDLVSDEVGLLGILVLGFKFFILIFFSVLYLVIFIKYWYLYLNL